MITVREHIDAILNIGDPARPGAMTEIRERAAVVLNLLDEAEELWRQTPDSGAFQYRFRVVLDSQDLDGAEGA